MAEPVTKPRRKRVLECPILKAALQPRPPRLECCVFGCRSSDRDRVTFHALPRHPDRWGQWLKPINRQDLADKLSSGHCDARICSLHFLPEQLSGGALAATAVPTLLLPSTSHGFVYDGSSSLLSVQVKPEVDEDIIEIKFESEEPPIYTFHDKTREPQEHQTEQQSVIIEQPCQASEPIIFNQHSESNQSQIHCETIEQPYQTSEGIFYPDTDSSQTQPVPIIPRAPEIILPDPQLSIIIPSIKPEPTYFDFQVHSEAQTDVKEAFDRIATFSAVEQINIPTVGLRRLGDVSTRSASTYTTPELVEVLGNDLRRKYALEIEEANKKLQSLERPHMEKLQFLKGCDIYLDEKIAKFIKSHAYLNNKYVGKKLPADFKNFALKLYICNPKAYKYVERFFDLPSKDSIERFRMPITSGINQSLIEALKVKIDQKCTKGKMCVVCFDVMSLKKNLYYDVCYDYLCGMQEIDNIVDQKPAEYAAVITVRGLYGRWKQPISFALLAEKFERFKLKAWLDKTIAALFDIGLNVKVLVTNSNDKFLDVTIKEPYFIMNYRKIHHIYDVPDLFKSARDELMQYDFHIGDSIAKWEHIVNVYDNDKEQELKLMSIITEQHVRPDVSVKNDVTLATQLFSKTVAAAMHFHVVARLQNEQTKDTVQFVSKMSDIFDILYSRKLADAYRATASQQRFLKDTLQYLRTVQLKDKYGNVFESKFVTGLTVTIKSLMSLISDLKKSNMNYLLTKNLSKDFTQTYFEEIRRLCNSKPTPIKFTRAFRRLCLSNLLNNTKTTATGDDMMATLSKIAEYVKADMEKPETNQNTSLPIDITDYKAKWPTNEYIAGYLLSKCLERHSCEKLLENLCDYYKCEPHSKSELIEAFHFYNSKNIGKLCKIRPPTQLRQFVNYMEVNFNEYYRSSNVTNMGFGWSLYRVIENASFELPCPCFPIKFLKMLYIRLKIYSTVKFYKQII